MGQQDTLIEYFCPADNYGKGLLYHCCLEDGTPIVARYNNREFQFGIYGEGYVIYQDCWQTKAGVLVFSLEQSSIEGFFEDSTVYEYTPDFEFDKKKAYYNARRNFSEPGNSVWG